jgi:hypothetical protein
MRFMKFTQASLLRSFIATAALLGCGAASAQQASFAVAVTLHAASKPMAAAQLCPEGKPMDVLGVAVRVDCRTVANASSTNVLGGPASSPRHASRPPEVTVTF